MDGFRIIMLRNYYIAIPYSEDFFCFAVVKVTSIVWCSNLVLRLKLLSRKVIIINLIIIITRVYMTTQCYDTDQSKQV